MHGCSPPETGAALAVPSLDDWFPVECRNHFLPKT
jgi:hypothetical protein